MATEFLSYYLGEYKHSYSFFSNTISANIESLDQLDVLLIIAFIVKRFYLIRLVEAYI